MFSFFKINIIFILIYLLLFNIIYSQQKLQTLKGQIFEKGNETPIVGANIVIKDYEPPIGTVSDEYGYFKIEKIPVGRVSIEISCIGYKSQKISNIIINSGKETFIEIFLEPQIYEISEVNINAMGRKDKPVNEMAMISARSFTVEETEKYAGSLGDPARMAANFAGVSTSSDQQNYIIIRGNSPQGLLWRMEGIDIPNPNHFAAFGSTGGAISILNNNVLSKSDFYTGAFPAEYGNALSGVFDLQMRNGNNEKNEFLGQVGFNGFEIGAEGPFAKQSKASYIANIRYSTMQVFNALGISFGTGNAIPEYKDINFKINIPSTKYGRFVIFGVGGLSYIEILDSKNNEDAYGLTGNDLYFGSNMGILGLKHGIFLSEKIRLNTGLSISTSNNSTKLRQLSYNMNEPDIIEKLYDHRYCLSSKLNYKHNNRNFFQTGLIFNLYNIDYTGKHYDTAYKKFFYHMNTQGTMTSSQLYAQWLHNFSNNLSSVFGIHSFYLFMNNSYSIEPRFSIQWSLNDNNKISAGYGLHSQMLFTGIYFANLLVDTTSMIYSQPNKNLDLMRSHHFVTSYDHCFNEFMRLKTELYYQLHYNIPISSERPEFSLLNSGGDYGYVIFKNMTNSGTGRNYGIELTIEKYLHKGFYYLITATLFDAKYKGYDKIERHSRFANNYVFNFIAGYEWKVFKSSFFAIDIKTVYAGGMRYVPIDTIASSLLQKETYEWQNSFKERYNDYFRLNARVSFKLNGKKTHQEWALDLQNITNHKNVFMQTWKNRDNKLVTVYQMGFIPALTYRINF